MGYEDCVDDPVLSRTRGHARLTEFRIDDRTLRDYSPPLIVNVRRILNNPQKLRFRRLTRRLVRDNSPVSRRQFYFRSPTSDSHSSLLDFTQGRLDWFSAGFEGAFSTPVALNATSGFLLVLVAMVSRQSNRLLTDGLDILTVPRLRRCFHSMQTQGELEEEGSYDGLTRSIGLESWAAGSLQSQRDSRKFCAAFNLWLVSVLVRRKTLPAAVIVRFPPYNV